MGWNSWDGYGTTINEADFKANADWFAKHLKPSGWQYVVIDMEWFVSNPVAEGNSKTFQYNMDGYGRYIPPASRFPSAANDAGFKPLADYVHSLGLKFGIHILRGIPKQAVASNLPIAGSSYHAADAGDTSDSCSWNFDNYGIAENKSGGQAYYDSIAQLYASWGVDLIKVDCISSRPYKGDEIRMLSAALQKAGRPIVLSLSPGPAPIEKADEMSKYAQMWRISNDVWDLWHSTKNYPQGVGDQFTNGCQVGILVPAGTLARCRHAARGSPRARPRLGAGTRDAAYARRAADTANAVVDLPFAPDDRWRSNLSRRVDDRLAYKSRGHRRRSAFDRQPLGEYNRQSGCMVRETIIRERTLPGGLQCLPGLSEASLQLEGLGLSSSGVPN